MPPLVRRPRGIPGWQLGLVTGIGIIGGIYIWKPVFDKRVRDKAENIAQKAREEKSVKNE